MIQGIYTPNLVPFAADGSIDEGELRRMTHWLIEKGVSGLVTVPRMNGSRLRQESHDPVDGFMERSAGFFMRFP